MAPMVLIVSSDVVITIPPDPLCRTVETIAIEHRRFKQKLFTSTQQTSFSVFSFDVLLSVQLFDEQLKVGSELDLHLLGHVVNNGTFRVVHHSIVEGKVYVVLKCVQRMIASILKFLSNCSEIHWLLNYFKIIWQTEFHRIYWTVENPTMLMTLEDFHSVKTLGLQLQWIKLQSLVKRCNMRFYLFD